MRNWQWFVIIATLSALWVTFVEEKPSKLEVFLIGSVLLWLVILEVAEKGKLNIDRHAILLIIKTERGKELIFKIASYARFWRAVGYPVAFVGIVGTLVMVGMLVIGFYFLSVKRIDLLQPTPLVPGYTIPFWYGIIGLISVLVVHELAHGIIATVERVSIKSLGIALVGVVPMGAFVEPDEEKLKSSSWLTQLKVYSAGSAANLLLAFLVSLSIPFYISAMYETTGGGVQIIDVVEGSPASQVLEKGMIIKKIQDEAIDTIEDFYRVVMKIKPGERISIVTDRGRFYLVTASREDNPEQGFIGVRPFFPVKDEFRQYVGLVLPLVIFYSLYWIALLNQAIGFVNLAPLHLGIAATDGHHIFRLILEKFFATHEAERLSAYVSTAMVLILLFSIFKPSFLMAGG
jgi:membrane-associated protease RseP (regulator of RpoE activity)